MDHDEDDSRIISRVKDALSKSSSWDEKGFLRLAPDKWLSLRSAATRSPELTGIYALGLSAGLHYDKGVSRIIYLGSARNVRKRLYRHRAKPHNDIIELFQQYFNEDVHATWWAIPSLNRKFLYGIEGEALWAFEQEFGTVPLCNLDIPEFFEGSEYCRGLVKIVPCDADNPLSIRGLAKKLDRVPVIRKREPHRGVSIVYTSDSVDMSRSTFRAVELLTAEEITLEKQRERTRQEAVHYDQRETEEATRIYEFALIHDVNLAVWSVNKMREIIKHCNQLRPKSTRAKIMNPFEAPFRKVPKPHTWGEVALVQARIISGSWQPGHRAWIKVVYGKELLGEAKLNMGWYVGEDKSDLPQRKTTRLKYEEAEPNDEPVEILRTKEVIYGLEIETIEYATGNSTLEQIRKESRDRQEAIWQAVEDIFQQARRA